SKLGLLRCLSDWLPVNGRRGDAVLWQTCSEDMTNSETVIGDNSNTKVHKWSFTDDEDDFGPGSRWIEHLILLDELCRLRQVRVALNGELADGREAVVASVGEIGTVGQHCHTHT
ncbi:hypothetical protein INR49_017785, partial [Caranx melampygus]